MTRKITTHYEAADGTEPDIIVEVERQDRFTALVVDDLDDMGVPADEQAGVRERAVDKFWAAEHLAWLRSPEGEASDPPGPRGAREMFGAYDTLAEYREGLEPQGALPRSFFGYTDKPCQNCGLALIEHLRRPGAMCPTA